MTNDNRKPTKNGLILDKYELYGMMGMLAVNQALDAAREEGRREGAAETAELQKRVRELEDGLKEMIRCTAVFKENLLSADCTLEEHTNAIAAARKLLNK
jgi:hypothetical protein